MNQGQNRIKWRQHISNPQHPLGAIKDVPFSFTNYLVDAHFQFAFFVLDLLGDINTIFQMKYGFVQNFWEYLVVFHRFLVGELRKMEEGDFGRFTYLYSVRVEDRPQFVKIMKHLILNMQVRFFRPSFSIDKRSFKDYLDYDQVCISPEAPIVDCSRCGLTQLFELFNLKQTRPETQNLGRRLGLALWEEMERLIPLLRVHHDLIQTKTDERSAACSGLEKKVRLLLGFPRTTNIIDVLCSTQKDQYSQLWRFLVRVLTVMPTTVECEQSFSYFKRTAHINMTEENAKNLLFTRLNLYETSYNLEFD